MTNLTQTVRGFRDISEPKSSIFHSIIQTAQKIAKDENFQVLELPIVEDTILYTRNLGETTDIVNKEIYTFQDRNENSISLRPEFTAGVARHFVNNGLHFKPFPIKLFSVGPLFRYERPQKGRYRQFTQLNFEIFEEESVTRDTSLISLVTKIMSAIGLTQQKDYKLILNYLLSKDSKKQYITALKEYFEKQKNLLSEDSLERLQKNPLRILDSKDEKDIKIVSNAPKMSQFYSEKEKQHIQDLQQSLQALNISYQIEEKLVRGLDYYDGLVFECIYKDNISQNAIVGGGQYSNLISSVSENKIQATGIGFAIGVDRLLEIEKIETKFADNRHLWYIIPMSISEIPYCFEIKNIIQSTSNAKIEIYNMHKNKDKTIEKIKKLECDMCIFIDRENVKKDTFETKQINRQKEGLKKYAKEEIKKQDFIKLLQQNNNH